MADLVSKLVAGRGWGERMALGRLRDAWASVVGAEVAARSEPIRLLRGTLTVRAEGGSWAAELTLLSARLAERADAFLGGRPPVKQVKVQGTSARSSGASGTGRKRGP